MSISKPFTMAPRVVSQPLQAVVALIGFTAVIAQIVLMRELLVIFQGNEISLGVMLASWLLWTAAGSSLFGRLATCVGNQKTLLAGLQTLLAVLFPLTIFFARASKAVFSLIPGEILGPGPMFITSLAVLSCLCVISGGMFAVSSNLYAESPGLSSAAATGSVYRLEAIGSGIGGLLASLVLLRYLDAFQIALILALLNLMAAAVLFVQSIRVRRLVIAALLITFVGFPAASRYLELRSLARLWHGFHLVATHNSVYGNLAVVETEGNRSLYESGLVFATAPDPAAAEEAVHFALLEHPSPQSLLLIGGGVNGGLRQALQHASLQRVDYVELDPAVLELAQRYFANEWGLARTDPRVNVHAADGRLFLKTTQYTFDVIVLDLPNPQTAQLNRFYTLEFFQEAAAKLNPGGVFSFQLRGSEDYISPELSDFLRCIHKTLRKVFPQVTTIPGDTIHFVATNQPGTLAENAQELLLRLKSRQLATRYVREYYIPFRLMPDRVRDLEEQIRFQPDTPINRDFAPIAYYFGVVLWSSQFNAEYHQLFQAIAKFSFVKLVFVTASLLIMLVAFLGRFTRGQSRQKITAGFSVAVMGWTLIGVEVLLLLGFQAIYGYVYQQLAIVIAAFMAGMAAGSWWSLRRMNIGAMANHARAMAKLQILAGLFPLLLFAAFNCMEHVHTPAGLFVIAEIVFPLLALLAGLLGGYQFPLASAVFFVKKDAPGKNLGVLYALDLLGACLGAVLLSGYLVPVFGFLKTAILIALVNLAPVALLVGPLHATE